MSFPYDGNGNSSLVHEGDDAVHEHAISLAASAMHALSNSNPGSPMASKRSPTRNLHATGPSQTLPASAGYDENGQAHSAQAAGFKPSILTPNTFLPMPRPPSQRNTPNTTSNQPSQSDSTIQPPHRYQENHNMPQTPTPSQKKPFSAHTLSQEGYSNSQSSTVVSPSHFMHDDKMYSTLQSPFQRIGPEESAVRQQPGNGHGDVVPMEINGKGHAGNLVTPSQTANHSASSRHEHTLPPRHNPAEFPADSQASRSQDQQSDTGNQISNASEEKSRSFSEMKEIMARMLELKSKEPAMFSQLMQAIAGGSEHARPADSMVQPTDQVAQLAAVQPTRPPPPSVPSSHPVQSSKSDSPLLPEKAQPAQPTQPVEPVHSATIAEHPQPVHSPGPQPARQTEPVALSQTQSSQSAQFQPIQFSPPSQSQTVAIPQSSQPSDPGNFVDVSTNSPGFAEDPSMMDRGKFPAARRRKRVSRAAPSPGSEGSSNHINVIDPALAQTPRTPLQGHEADNGSSSRKNNPRYWKSRVAVHVPFDPQYDHAPDHTGIIDGMPDLGKFPLLRRKRRTKKEMEQENVGSSPGTSFTYSPGLVSPLQHSTTQLSPPQPSSSQENAGFYAMVESALRPMVQRPQPHTETPQRHQPEPPSNLVLEQRLGPRSDQALQHSLEHRQEPLSQQPPKAPLQSLSQHQPESQPQPHPQPQPQPRPELSSQQLQQDHHSKASQPSLHQPPQSQPQTLSLPRPEPHPDPFPRQQLEHRPQPFLQQQPEPKPQPLPQPRPESHSQPTPLQSQGPPSQSLAQNTPKSISPPSTQPLVQPGTEIIPQRQQEHHPNPPLQEQSVRTPEVPKTNSRGQNVNSTPERSTTYWPDAKKHSLAQAASRYINDQPANKNRSCSIEFILGLIEQNPSYEELCRMFEANGYTLNRVHFAKHLLREVPDLAGGSSNTPSKSAQKPPVTPAPAPQFSAQPTQTPQSASRFLPVSQSPLPPRQAQEPKTSAKPQPQLPLTQARTPQPPPVFSPSSPQVIGGQYSHPSALAKTPLPPSGGRRQSPGSSMISQPPSQPSHPAALGPSPLPPQQEQREPDGPSIVRETNSLQSRQGNEQWSPVVSQSQLPSQRMEKASSQPQVVSESSQKNGQPEQASAKVHSPSSRVDRPPVHPPVPQSSLARELFPQSSAKSQRDAQANGMSAQGSTAASLKSPQAHPLPARPIVPEPGLPPLAHELPQQPTSQQSIPPRPQDLSSHFQMSHPPFPRATNNRPLPVNNQGVLAQPPLAGPPSHVSTPSKRQPAVPTTPTTQPTTGNDPASTSESQCRNDRQQTKIHGDPDSGMVEAAQPRSFRSGKKGSPERNNLPFEDRVSASSAQQPRQEGTPTKKRNFGDVVDLTQASDEEETTPKQRRVEESRETKGVPRREEGVVDAPPVSITDVDKRTREEDDARELEALRQRMDIVRPLNRQEAQKKSWYDPKTIARDVSIAAGRHPTERALNSHLTYIRDRFAHVDNSSDLETLRRNLVDPDGPPPPLSLEPLEPASKRPRLDLPTIQAARDPSKEASPPQVQGHQPPHATRPSTIETQPPPSQSHESVIVIEDTSNGPGSPANHASVVSAPTAMPSPNQRRRGRVSAETSHQQPPRPQASPQNSRVQVAVQQQGQRPAVEVSVPVQRPVFRVFKCQWTGCHAQLHNLQTLKKHLQRVHIASLNATSPHRCSWGGCDSTEQFSSRVTLADHVEKDHVSPVARAHGDGPSTLPPSVRKWIDQHEFLNDEANRQCTPLADEDGNPATLIFPTAYKSIWAFNREHGNVTDKAKALAVLQAVESKQNRVGVGLGREGCTFMNYARLQTVAGNEGVREVVDDEQDS